MGLNHSRSIRTFLLGTLVLSLMGSTALGATETAAAEEPAPVEQAAVSTTMDSTTARTGEEPVELGIGDPIAPATCTAVCQYGSNKTVNCGGSCSAVDQNCNAGQRGYAQCSGGSKVYCDPCPPTCTANCEYGPDRTITCTNGCAAEVDQNCAAGITGYVQCNGSPLRAFCSKCPACLNEYCSGGPCNSDADCCGTIDGGGFCSSWGSCICP